MDDADQSESLQHVRTWAKQSIAFALILRAEEAGKPIDSSQLATWAGKEADSRTDELWETSVGECGANAAFSLFVMTYARNVYDWCYSHMNPEK